MESLAEQEIMKRLRKIKEPETGVSILDLGIINNMRFEDGVCNVYVNFAYLNSSCIACTPILWVVVRSMVRKIERVMKEMGLRYRIVEAGKAEIYAQDV